jgi:hypothetical protein
MIESFITAFIVYFVVIDPVGAAPIFLAITTHLNKRQKIRTALEALAGCQCDYDILCPMRGVDPALPQYFTDRVSTCRRHYSAFGGA